MGPRIIIIGSGFAGICLGYYLSRAGLSDYIVLEKEPELGGTWRDNVYPGIACDVPSFLYCFSFEQKVDWSRKWAPGSEILAYMRHCAENFGIARHIRFSAEVAEASFDDDAKTWRVRTTSGEAFEADFLVSAVGQLNRPALPQLPGLDTFAGVAFHSARWQRGCELDDKDVVVVGNAASAIQLVPHVAGRARKLSIVQRSANWMMERGDRAYTRFEQLVYGHVPFAAKVYRSWLWLAHELRFAVFRQNELAARLATRIASRYLDESIPDSDLRQALLPDYPIGAKRILLSDDYYATLLRSNVELVVDAADHVEPRALVTRTGRRLPADVMIFATGFESTAFLSPMQITGSGGRSLTDVWRCGAEAYLGITVSGFPNFFIMYGPSTNLGHNSILFMLECQSKYIVRCIRRVLEAGARALDVRGEAMRRYADRVQAELDQTVWAAVDRSWYKNAEGRIVNNWPGTTFSYWRATRRVNPGDYEMIP